MRRIALLFLALLATGSAWGQGNCPLSHPLLQQAQSAWTRSRPQHNYNCRSDSADIEHYAVELELMQWRKPYLRGNCRVRLLALTDLERLSFDLALRLDSVLLDGRRLRFEPGKEQVVVYFNETLHRQQSVELHFFYQGKPPTGDWNGFYFSEEFVYNTGSSFNNNPLNYGRAWHPCFDNFRERATYTYTVKTPAPKIAQCNGYLVSREQKGDTIVSRWQIDQSIPSYLANIAAADYLLFRDTFEGVERRIPIEIAAVAVDTAGVRRGFSKLHQALSTMEKWFGGYAWNKVGYSVVPELSGAMEHATNTTFSRNLLNHRSTAEEFMIHELAHSWFGNQITCESGEDMWINEGLATYSEALFYEYTYGRAAMLRQLRKNKTATLPFHANDTFFPPLSGATHAFVYDGQLIYNRGALIGHCLRGYLGDSLFALGMKAVMRDFRYRSINSVQLRDALGQATGSDLTHFFDDWVFAGGYVNVRAEARGNTWTLRQELLGRQRPYTGLPVELYLLGDKGEYSVQTLTMNSSEEKIHPDSLPFSPAMIWVDAEQKLFLARDPYMYRAERSVDSGFRKVADLTDWKLQTDHPFRLWICFHYTPPQGEPPAGCRMSRYGYWEYQAEYQGTAQNALRLRFSTCHQDVLTQDGKYSIVLLHRKNSDEAWREYAPAKLSYENREKRTGYFTLNQPAQGQYAIGIR